MLTRLTQAWRTRRWYDAPLLLLGLTMLLFGGTFFVFVSAVGAPVVPYGGLTIALFGLWIGVLRPLNRSSDPAHSDPRE